MIKKIVIVSMVLCAVFLSGCMGYGEGYGEAVQEMTSADYTIGTYKEYLDKYHAVCNVGSSAENAEKSVDEFLELFPNRQLWGYSEMDEYGRLTSVRDGYIAQYNRLASEYNDMTDDKTMDWIIGVLEVDLPEEIPEYTTENHLTNSDAIDDKILGSELLGE